MSSIYQRINTKAMFLLAKFCYYGIFFTTRCVGRGGEPACILCRKDANTLVYSIFLQMIKNGGFFQQLYLQDDHLHYLQY